MSYAIDAQELATRLSYFLWSFIPDKELMDVAKSDSLKKPENSLKQVDRMLNSSRRIYLSENFTAQWLSFNEIRDNKDYYLNEVSNRGIYDEMLFAFDELIKSGRSVLELVDSNWVYTSYFIYQRKNILD